ncbi:type II toxin-antitoxin system VapC family toxin [Candidatus Poribacteria bacterium]|nr:type II toxin-antitoxin system VapC family toxin [Candidatus Poribacteria bacterium]
MDRSLLDTDMLSEVLKGIDRNVVAKAVAYHATFGHYTICVVTITEIVKGYHKIQREDRIRRFLAHVSNFEVLILDGHSAELAGRIIADLERTGQPIGVADSMIAAIALQHDLTVVTGNLSHYQRIQSLGYGLKLDNWR